MDNETELLTEVRRLERRIEALESEKKSLLEANRELRDAALGRTEYSR